MQIVKSEYNRLQNQLQASRANLQDASQVIHNLVQTDSKLLFVDPSIRLAELSGRQMFLERALEQQLGGRIDSKADNFGFIGIAVAMGGLAALSLGSWIYHQYTETKQFKDKMNCYSQLRQSGMTPQEAAKNCFGRGGLLSMLGLDPKTLGLVGGAFLLVYWIIKKVS